MDLISGVNPTASWWLAIVLVVVVTLVVATTPFTSLPFIKLQTLLMASWPGQAESPAAFRTLKIMRSNAPVVRAVSGIERAANDDTHDIHNVFGRSGISGSSGICTN